MLKALAILSLVVRTHSTSFAEENLAALSAPQFALFSRIEAGDVSKSQIEIVLAECHDDVGWIRPEYAPLSTTARA